MRAIALLILLAGLIPWHVATADCDIQPPVKDVFDYPQFMKDHASFHDYEIRIFSAGECADSFEEPGGFEVLRGGKMIHSETGFSFSIGYPLDGDQSPDSVKVAVGNDITGQGIPDALISENSGGAHCCYTFHILQLGSQFKDVQEIPLLDADESSFVRRLGIKSLVLSSADFSDFDYFPASFARSPAGRVFLSFQAGKFALDTSLMRSNVPVSDAINKCALLFKQSRDWKGTENAGQPAGLWYYATDLIYTGNEAAAWTFLDQAWGGSAADKKKYLDDYRQRLKRSVYYQGLESLQKAPMSDAGQKIDWTKQCFEYLRG
ncbi:MAG TPA: hypothetical protein VGM47_03835 [Gammaproteobacteria bacterium]